jgi:3-oxoacyl-[acyl-carrier-protein] synthase-3
MVMSDARLGGNGHRYTGCVTRSASQFNQLCRGHMEWMETDTRVLLKEGLKLAKQTYLAAVDAMGWQADALDHIVIHQVSKIHTESFVELLGLDPRKVHTIYQEMGNIGPASVPITLAHAVDLGKVNRGDRVALMGIGSGLNCSMAEVLW